MWRGNGTQVEEYDWWGSPARLGRRSKKKKKRKRKTNPSHSLFKAANVSFEEIILFGHLIALGNYEPLQGMSGITRTSYQRGQTELLVLFTLFFFESSEKSVTFGVSSGVQRF